MTSYAPLQYVVWVLPAAVQLYVLWLMWKKDLHQEFPHFFFYTAFQVVNAAWLLAAYQQSQDLYFYSYWTTAGLSCMLGLAVVREVFLHSFKHYEGLSQLGRMVFRWAVVVLVLVATLVAANAAPQNSLRATLNAIMNMEKSIRIMQFALLVLLASFSAPLGLSTRNRIFGIALGLGLFAGADICMMTLVSIFGSKALWIVNPLKGAFYVASTVIWATYMARPEPARVESQTPEWLHDWDAALAPATAGQPQTFLSSIEKTVEQVVDRQR